MGFAAHGFENNQRVTFICHRQRVLPCNSLDAALQRLVVVGRNVDLVALGVHAVRVWRHKLERFALNVAASAKNDLE
jgi:hypothetical protein